MRRVVRSAEAVIAKRGKCVWRTNAKVVKVEIKTRKCRGEAMDDRKESGVCMTHGR